MPVGVPGSNSRGRGGKFKKFTRGGGKNFSRDLQPVDGEGNLVSIWSENAQEKDDDDDDDDDEEESSSEEDGDEEATKDNGDSSRDDRKAMKKARKEAALAKQKAKIVEVGDMPSSDEESEADMPANPNHSSAARKQASTGATVEEITAGVKNLPASRKEREAVEAAAAKERYMKLHTQGKTDEAKADLARLRLIREQRAAESARRQAEKEERDEQERAKRTDIEAKEAKRREAAAGPKKSSKKK